MLFDQKFFHNRNHVQTVGDSENQASKDLSKSGLTITETDYTKLFETLAAAEVKAIVFDIIIDTRRHSTDDIRLIAETIQGVVSRKIPIIVAQIQSSDRRAVPDATDTCKGSALPGMQPPLIACAASVVAPVEWSPPFDDWDDKVHFAALYYPHYVERAHPTPGYGCKKPDAPATVLDPTPAWAAYLLVNNTVAPCPESHDKVLDHDLFLAWGRGETVCEAAAGNEVNTDFWWHARLALAALFGSVDTPTSCSYIPRFSAADLGKIPKERLRGRVVFVGIDDPYDLIDLPQGGQIPGVFQHATALDNLLTAGQQGVLDLHPSSNPVPFVGINGKTIFVFIAVLLVFKTRLLHEWVTSQYGRWRRGFVYVGLQVILATLLITVVAYPLDVARIGAFVVVFCVMIADPIIEQITNVAKL